MSNKKSLDLRDHCCQAKICGETAFTFDSRSVSPTVPYAITSAETWYQAAAKTRRVSQNTRYDIGIREEALRIPVILLPQKFNPEAENDRMLKPLKEEHSPILHGWILTTGISSLAQESPLSSSWCPSQAKLQKLEDSESLRNTEEQKCEEYDKDTPSTSFWKVANLSASLSYASMVFSTGVVCSFTFRVRRRIIHNPYSLVLWK